MSATTTNDLFRSRWRGQPGRLEVWYTTATDPTTGTGVWVHHELVSPSDGAGAYAHGWAAVFPPRERPVLARFGPQAWASPETGFRCARVEATAGGVRGRAAELSWELIPDGAAGPPGVRSLPLYTFPRWAWQRELLPAAQIVPQPAERFRGTVRYGDRVLELVRAPGATARIYGHGNARRWAWLHADLGDGDVCEIIAAVSTRPGLDRLRPMPFVRLRSGGEDWPHGNLRAVVALRAIVDLPTWTVQGRLGDRALHVEVTMPPDESVAVDYRDPDGSMLVCHNSERAVADIAVSRRIGRRRWHQEHRWRLDGTAHAEVGLR